MAAAHASLRICAPCALAGASSSCFSSRVGQKLHLGAALKLKQCPAISVLSRRSSSVARAAVVELDELVERIKNMSLADCRSLTDKLQEELGVTAAAFAPVAAGGAVAPAEAAPAVEEKTEFDVVLDEVPANARIAVIKVIRALTGLGLKESKDLIEGLPKNVKEGAGKEDAEDAKKQLEAAGAKCSLK